MGNKIKFRCENCGKIFIYHSEMAGKTKVCEGCNATHIIPDRAGNEERKFLREVVIQSSAAIAPDISSTRGQRPAHLMIIYSEAPPIEVATHRKGYGALLDISTGGLGFIYQKEDDAPQPVPGEIIPLEIDFPVLVQPIFIETEIRWVKGLNDDNNLLKLGVKFIEPNKKFMQAVNGLMDYLKSRPQVMEIDKWGAFG